MIVEETIVRQKVAQKDYKEYSDAMLAQAVVARAVEMEVCVTVFMPYHGEFMLCSLQRHRRAEIKQKLEFLAKLEIVEKVKVLKFDPIISFLIIGWSLRVKDIIQVALRISMPMIHKP